MALCSELLEKCIIDYVVLWINENECTSENEW